jgi:hypothetical protein
MGNITLRVTKMPGEQQVNMWKCHLTCEQNAWRTVGEYGEVSPYV